MERFICVHAHFYQPPRENPWLEAIEPQDSAYPYHDWNERITAECYAPNMVSRVLDQENRIQKLVNNYTRISFNFGPTLLSWLALHARDLYAAILEADRESAARFSGHGSALAQVYNHMILPLANRRDKITQVTWGIRDFEHRFGRKPEGMWLSETAVDLETLDVLAEKGIRFTVLAPHQACRIRPMGESRWTDLDGAQADPSRAYLQRLPSGREISLFFYDGPISRAVAFEKLLESGEAFAQRLVSGFSDTRTWPQLMHIATDGETFGHHHKYGEMALSHALDAIESKGLARLTNYGEFLELHPPAHEVEIVENTSWSCAHGIERWKGDCGCSSGYPGNWNQKWRKPLRHALDQLRDSLAGPWEKKARQWLKDPWQARDRYIDVVLDRSAPSFQAFLDRHTQGLLSPEEEGKVCRLLELQRNAMLMYTSCGWFFDDISGIETVQILQYAGRVLQLAESVLGESHGPSFLKKLKGAKSNLPEMADGRRIYTRFVEAARVDPRKVAAHYAMTSLFQEYPRHAEVYCFSVEREDYRLAEAGMTRLAVGRVKIDSRITRRSARLSFCVIHLGDHNLSCGIRSFKDEEGDLKIRESLFSTFATGDFTRTIRLQDKHFGTPAYAIESLFKDEQREILDIILQSTLKDAEAGFEKVYEYHAPLMRYLQNSGIALPKALYLAAEFTLNKNLRAALAAEALEEDTLLPLLEEADLEKIPLDHATLEYRARRTLEGLTSRLRASPQDSALLEQALRTVTLMEALPFELHLWTVQNNYFEVLENTYPAMKAKAAGNDSPARQWVDHFLSLGEKLKIRVPD